MAWKHSYHPSSVGWRFSAMVITTILQSWNSWRWCPKTRACCEDSNAEQRAQLKSFHARPRAKEDFSHNQHSRINLSGALEQTRCSVRIRLNINIHSRGAEQVWWYWTQRIPKLTNARAEELKYCADVQHTAADAFLCILHNRTILTGKADCYRSLILQAIFSRKKSTKKSVKQFSTSLFLNHFGIGSVANFF